MPDGHRWSGYSHEELYEKINSGPGPNASHASMERWQGVSAALTEINAELHSGVMRSGATWEGSAADQARSGINPLAAWADDARTGAEVMRTSAELQADFISKARADMPPPVKVTAEDPGLVVDVLTHLVGGQTDYELQEKAHNAAEQRAREVMSTYASSTTSNTSTLGQFHQPPQLVISAPDIVRNDAAGVGGTPGFGYGGPRGGGRGGYGGRWGSRPVRGGAPAPTAQRPAAYTPGSGTSTSTTGTTTGSSAAGSTTRTSIGAGTGGATQHSPTFGSGGVIGGSGDRDRRDRRDRGTSDTTTAEQSGSSSSSSSGGSGSPSAADALVPHATGTTATSSTEFGALSAANAQHSSMGAGGSAGSLLGGGTGTAGGGDTVHKRTTPAPQQPAFDPFGGIGARSADGEEDAVHDAADYLRETDDLYGVGGIISPPVIGEG